MVYRQSYLILFCNLFIKNSKIQKLKVKLSITGSFSRGTQRQFSENIGSEDDLRSRIFGTFVVKSLACLPLLGFSNVNKMA